MATIVMLIRFGHEILAEHHVLGGVSPICWEEDESRVLTMHVLYSMGKSDQYSVKFGLLKEML